MVRFYTFLISLGLCSGANAQEVTIILDKAPFPKAVDYFILKSGHNIVYSPEDISVHDSVTCRIINQPVKKAMAIFLSGFNLDFKYDSVRKQFLLFVNRTRQTGNIEKTNIVCGIVKNIQLKPITSVNIFVKHKKICTASGEDGRFMLPGAVPGDTLILSCIGYNTRMYIIGKENPLEIVLLLSDRKEPPVVVIAAGKKADENPVYIINEPTSSIQYIDTTRFKNVISPFFVERVFNQVSGMDLAKPPSGKSKLADLQIRGRITILGDIRPRVFVNNFPYNGDLDNLNPSDIQAIRVLKDAASAAQFGPYSGNGVILITTKKGSYNSAPVFSLTTGITIGNKPNLNYLPQLSIPDYLDFNKFLYSIGYFNQALLSSYQNVPIDIKLLEKKEKGLITEKEYNEGINELLSNNFLSDLEKYLYRPLLNKQLAINAQGGGKGINYYLSIGFDRNESTVVGDSYKRVTFNSINNYKLTGKIQFETQFSLTNSIRENNSIDVLGKNYSPYTRFMDQNGPAIVPINLSTGYTDTAGNGKLLNWDNIPLHELRYANNKTRLTDYLFNLGINYNFLTNCTFTLQYQFGKGVSDQAIIRSIQTYYTRNLINSYSYIDPQTGDVIRPIPFGGIRDLYKYFYKAHLTRAAFKYANLWKGVHDISFTAGFEKSSMETQSSSNREYGFKPVTQSGINVDYTTLFPLYYAPFFEAKIPDLKYNLHTIAKSLAYYANLLYTFNKKYSVSLTARKDFSNALGATSNRNGSPLLAAGTGWVFSNESFYPFKKLFPYLRIKVSHGYTGNIVSSVSPYTSVAMGVPNSNGFQQASVASLPNSALSMETVGITNAGIDFATKDSVVTGTVEVYRKKSDNLVGDSPADPLTGMSTYIGNEAGIEIHGADMTLSIQFTRRKKINWATILYAGYVGNRVTRYNLSPGNASFMVNPIGPNPVVGRPLNGMFSYYFAGLDHKTGSPLGLLNNRISMQYGEIANSQDLESLVFHGTKFPKLFGSIRNIFQLDRLELSFTIGFKFDYYLRISTINYSAMANNEPGHPDYALRWKEVGDEQFTTVPSRGTSLQPDRDNFYFYSTENIIRGDHIRLQDIQVVYTPGWKLFNKQFMKINFYCTNPTILWKKNDKGIDPDAGSNLLPEPTTIAVGLQMNF